MFSTAACASARTMTLDRRYLPLAGLLHATALSIFLTAPYWRIEPVALPAVAEPFIHVVLPDLGPARIPPAQAPAREQPAGPAPEARQPQTATPGTPTPPVTQPETLPATQPGPAGPSPGSDLPGPERPAGPATSGGGDGDCVEDCGGSPAGGGDLEGPVVIVPGITPPRVLERVVPAYPEVARKPRKTGRVVIEAVIDAAGRVTSAQVVSDPLGFGLEESALAAVRQWRFSPAVRGDRPVAVFFRLTVDFALR